MGWMFSSRWTNKAALRAHLTEDDGVKTVKSCWTGNNLWAVQEYTYKDGEKSGQTVQFVALYLCRFCKDEGGYKDMDESAGPNYRNCPLSYIEMVEAHERANGYGPTGYAAGWRQQVRDAKAKANRKLTPGTKIKLYGQPYTVAGRFPSGNYAVFSEHGHEFRLRRNQVKDVELEAA